MKKSLVATTALLALFPALATATADDYDAGFNISAPVVEADETVAAADETVAAQDGALAITTDAHGEVTEMAMLSDVAFEFGSARLSPRAVAVLEIVAGELDGAAALEIVGHTDSIGSDAQNLALGLARAQAVGAWLQSNGYFVDSDLILLSEGEANPVLPNVLPDGSDDANARAQNRRVTFHVMEPEQDTPVEAAFVDDAVAAEDVTSVEEAVSADEVVSVEDAASVVDALSVDEAASVDVEATADEAPVAISTQNTRVSWPI